MTLKTRKALSKADEARIRADSPTPTTSTRATRCLD
jgi:hypothetical protein